MAKAQTKKKAAKVIKKATGSKKVSAKKTAVKKTVRKKAAVAKKKAVPNRRKVSTRVTKAPIAAKTARKKTITNKVKKQRPAKTNKVPLDVNLQPVEEKSPVTHSITENLPDMNEKEQQHVAVRNYDNHHIRLSSIKKGGPKPSGKKPLW